jgi:hypothetical protein
MLRILPGRWLRAAGKFIRLVSWIAFPGKNYRIAADFMGKKAMNKNNGSSFSTKTSHYP